MHPFYSTTLISGTKGVKNGVKGCPKRHLFALRGPRDREQPFSWLVQPNATKSAALRPPSLSPIPSPDRNEILD